MLKLGRLILNLEQEERDAEQFGKEVFLTWREHYLCVLLAAIRLKHRMTERRLPSTIDADWCNAAALILDMGTDALVDRFLRSTPQEKNKFVSAVIDDGGMFDHKGFWVEIPVI